MSGSTLPNWRASGIKGWKVNLLPLPCLACLLAIQEVAVAECKLLTGAESTIAGTPNAGSV